MKLFFVLFVLFGLTVSDNCGSNKDGFSGKSLRQRSFVRSHRGLTQNFKGANLGCFPILIQPAPLVQLRPAIVPQPKTVTITVTPNVPSMRIVPVSQPYVQPTFFPTVDFYPWGNSGSDPIYPNSRNTVTVASNNATLSTSESTSGISLSQHQPINTQGTATQTSSMLSSNQSSVILTVTAATQPTPTPITQNISQTPPTVSSIPSNNTNEIFSNTTSNSTTPNATSPPTTSNQESTQANNSYLFNQDNSNQNLNLEESDSSTGTTTSVTPPQTNANSSSPTNQTQSTLPTTEANFEGLDFTDFDLNNLDSLVESPPAPTPILDDSTTV